MLHGWTIDLYKQRRYIPVSLRFTTYIHPFYFLKSLPKYNLSSSLRSLHLVIYSADIQDKDSTSDVMEIILKYQPWLWHIFANSRYTRLKLKCRLEKVRKFTLKIVKWPDQASSFQVLLHQQVVKYTFTQLGSYYRLAKDYEKTVVFTEV